jgi:hypothetical protein
MSPSASTKTTTAVPSQTVSAFPSNMSDDSPHSSYALVPILTKDNFIKWEIQVWLYLTGTADHVRMIRHTKDAAGMYADPAKPTDPGKGRAWDKSEHVALGVIMVTASDLHFKLVHRMGKEPVWKLWKAIGMQHEQHNTSLCHEAWMQLFALRKKPTETYINFYQ